MINLKTYLSLMINTDSCLPSEITNKLEVLGFETSLGSHDFVYTWKDEVTHEHVVSFIDRVQQELKGMNVRFNVTSMK